MADGRVLTRERREALLADNKVPVVRACVQIADSHDAADRLIATLRDSLRECMEHLDADHPDDRAIMQRASAALDASK